MQKIGFVKPELFEALDDLTVDERDDELAALLGREPAYQEVAEFADLVLAARAHSRKKRKTVLAALDNPGLRKTRQVESIYTARDMIIAGLNKGARLAPESYPVATKKKRENKEALRDRIVAVVVRILERCEFPITRFAVSSVAPERILARFGAGKCTGTLQEKVRCFKVMEIWMQASVGKSFPTFAVELLDYILER